jgi:hypothetical protein
MAEGTLKGRRFFFATRRDLLPGLRAIEQSESLRYVLNELRDDAAFGAVPALQDDPVLGHSTTGDVVSSPQYFVFREGDVPQPRAVPQRRGGTKYVLEPTGDCVILKCGGVHDATGALVAGELQQPLEPSRAAVELFRLFTRELFRDFTRVGLYWLGPEALKGFRAGQRLVTIGVRSPRAYDLADLSS